MHTSRAKNEDLEEFYKGVIKPKRNYVTFNGKFNAKVGENTEYWKQNY